MPLPPGISYLLRKSPSLLVPPILTYICVSFVRSRAGFGLPRWAVICLTLVAKPLQFWVWVQYTRFRDRREAQALGAKIAPPVEDSALTIMTKLMEMFERGYPGDPMVEWSVKHGKTYQTRLFTDSFIWTTDPEHVKTILATDFDNWPKEPLFIEQAHSLMGNGIFAANGDIWKFHRGMSRPFFTRDRISDFDIFDVHAAKALDLAKTRLAEGHAIDFQELTARFTLDSASVFLFDDDLESLGAGLAYPHNCTEENAKNQLYREHPSNEFSGAFLGSITETTKRTFLGSEWPLMEFWADKVKPHRDVVDRFSEKVIQQHLKKKRETKDGNGEETRDTFLAHLLEKTQDSALIKDALYNILLAGRDTTSCTLTCAMYELTRNPGIASRLREEIINQVGPSRRPDYDDIKEMKYLRAFVNEVLRLYPPVPFNWRYAKRGTILASKDRSERFYVPPKTTVRYPVFVMHRSKELWGPDADQFDPDRFLDERMKKYVIPNPYIFIPFNAGPRICLGQQFAYHEVSFFLVRLFQQFSEFSFAKDAQDPQFVPPETWSSCEGTKGREQVMLGASIAMYVKGGLWVRLK